MSHKLGVYLAPGHNRPSDLDYIRRLQPAVVRILDPDVQQIVDVHAAAPNAVIMPRFWWLDDGRSDSDPHGQLGQLQANPEATGRRHAAEWKREIERLEAEAAARGLKFPPRAQLVVSGVNEPNQGVDAGDVAGYQELERQITRYSIALADDLTAYGLIGALLCLGVGHVALLNAQGLPDWSRYMPLQAAITRGGHWVALNEYWYKSGPQDGFGWYWGRHAHCPLDAKIVIGEAGIDNAVDDKRWSIEGGPRGWLGNVSSETYGDQIVAAHNELEPSVICMLIFLTDVRDSHWSSFDTEGAHSAILARLGKLRVKAVAPKPIDTHLPQINNGGTASPAMPLMTTGVLDPLVMEAVISQESGGKAYGDSGDVLIRFEAHVFASQANSPASFAQHFRFNLDQPWTDQEFRSNVAAPWRPIHTGSQADEWAAFNVAAKINQEAAYRSISMGVGQVMGFNHARLGYPSASVMYAAFERGAAAQVMGMINFILKDSALVTAINNRDWRTIARLYNGPGNVDAASAKYQRAYARLVG